MAVRRALKNQCLATEQIIVIDQGESLALADKYLVT